MAVTRQYKCESCDKIFEEKVSIKEPVRTHCDCGEEIKTIYRNKKEILFFNNHFCGAQTKTHGHN